MANDAKQIMNKLDRIKADLDYIRDHIADVDIILTQDDLDSLQEAEEDLAK